MDISFARCQHLSAYFLPQSILQNWEYFFWDFPLFCFTDPILSLLLLRINIPAFNFLSWVLFLSSLKLRHYPSPFLWKKQRWIVLDLFASYLFYLMKFECSLEAELSAARLEVFSSHCTRWNDPTFYRSYVKKNLIGSS